MEKVLDTRGNDDLTGDQGEGSDIVTLADVMQIVERFIAGHFHTWKAGQLNVELRGGERVSIPIVRVEK
jgi:hypothetical protein